jgi:chromosome segregation ATPase
MNNTNNRSFTQRGRELLEQLKQFIIDVNSNTTNKQAQLNTIISELQEVEQKVSNIHLKFLRKYNSIKGTSDKPEEYPKIMQMDAYLAKLQANKNKEEKNKKNEENRLAEEQRKLNEAKTANISNKSKTIRETIDTLRRQIGNSNASSNNNVPTNRLGKGLNNAIKFANNVKRMTPANTNVTMRNALRKALANVNKSNPPNKINIGNRSIPYQNALNIAAGRRPPL